MKKIVFIVIVIMMVLPAFSRDFVLEYRCGQFEDEINKIKPQFKILNNGTESVPLSEFTIRYWFSSEGYVESELSVDYAQVGNAGIRGTFHEDYLEIGFTPGAGEMTAGGDSGEVQLRLEKVSHGFYIQTDDWSFAPGNTGWGPNERATCYRNGTLVWGEEPPPPPQPTPPPPADDDWLHTRGGTIRDKDGFEVRLTGINWFGFETNPQGLGGLQAINWMETLDMLTERGFNLLRLPLSLEIIRGWMAGSDPRVQFVSGEINPTIDGVSSLTLLDRLIGYCKEIGLKIMFDMHTLDSVDIQKKVWYNSTYSASDFRGGWVWLAERYKNDDTVIACDIFNEPHGQAWTDTNGAIWDGSNDSNNWRKGAEDTALAILAVNPNLLIMVEGVETTPIEGAVYGSNDKYDYVNNWWGGNLREVKNHPVDLGSHQDQLVYSPHDYGPDIYVQPWFQSSFSMDSLYRECWQPNWFYIVEENIAPILIGEWGGRLGGDNQQWLEALSSFIAREDLNHTFWCFNPDSHDTGGIVDEDYNFETAKYNIIEKTLWQSGGKFIGLDHQVTLTGTSKGTNVALYYGTHTPTEEPPTNQPSDPPTTPPPTDPPTSGPLTGDVNGSGTVDIVDALMTAQYYVGLGPIGFNPSVADVNGSGSIDIVDALMIAQYYVGLIDSF